MTVLRELAGDVPVALGHPPADCEPLLRRCLAAGRVAGRPRDRGRRARPADRAAHLRSWTSPRPAAGPPRARGRDGPPPTTAALAYGLDAVKTAAAYLGPGRRAGAGRRGARTAAAPARRPLDAAVDGLRELRRPAGGRRRRRRAGPHRRGPARSAGAAATPPTSRSSSPTWAGCTGWPDGWTTPCGRGAAPWSWPPRTGTPGGRRRRRRSTPARCSPPANRPGRGRLCSRPRAAADVPGAEAYLLRCLGAAGRGDRRPGVLRAGRRPAARHPRAGGVRVAARGRRLPGCRRAPGAGPGDPARADARS